jgi:DHA1 family multidrug resistance protein-like MFS transporter
MMVRAGLAAGAAYVLMAVATSPWQLLGIRALIGAFSGLVPIAQAIVAVTTPREQVGPAISTMQTAWPAGTLIGPAVGGVLYDLFGIRWAMGLSALLVLGGVGLALGLVREQHSPAAAPAGSVASGLAADLRAAAAHPGLLGLLLITILAQGAMATLEPVFVPFVKGLAGDGTPNWLAGTIYALPGVAFIAGAPWWARRAARMGFATTLAWGLGAAAVLMVLQGMALSPYDLALFRLGGGLAAAAIGPGVAALLALSVPVAMRGKAYGLNQSFNKAGQVIGPLLGGFAGTYLGSRYAFFVGAAGLAAAFLWVRRLAGRQGEVAGAGAAG